MHHKEIMELIQFFHQLHLQEVEVEQQEVLAHLMHLKLVLLEVLEE